MLFSLLCHYKGIMARGELHALTQSSLQQMPDKLPSMFCYQPCPVAWLGSWLKTRSCKAELLTSPTEMNCLPVPSKSKIFLSSPFLQSEPAPRKVQRLLLLGSTGPVLLEEGGSTPTAPFFCVTYWHRGKSLPWQRKVSTCIRAFCWVGETVMRSWASLPTLFLHGQLATCLNAQCTWILLSPFLIFISALYGSY